MDKTALSGMTLYELEEVIATMELPRFAAKQMAGWIYRKQIFGIDEMTNLSKSARERLSERYVLGRSKPVEAQTSRDGTIKYLFRTQAGDFVETVYIPSGDRATLCVSSQVGCKMGCLFCMTGRQGYHGNLNSADILNQIYSIPDWDKLTNIVYMGQGEPMDNLDNVMRTAELLTAPYGMAWSPKRITVSTVGLRKGLKHFLEHSECNLAVSLHFPTPELRQEYMPAEKAFSMRKMVELLKNYDFCRDLEPGEMRLGSRQRRLSFEYILFKGVNDSERYAQSLAGLLKGLDCRVNIIPFHAIPNSPLRGCNARDMCSFRDRLQKRGLLATIRASRGQDISAACGLLNTARQKREKSGGHERLSDTVSV